jgi:hypothetical protein
MAGGWLADLTQLSRPSQQGRNPSDGRSCAHIAVFLTVWKFARRLKTLIGRTPNEYIRLIQQLYPSHGRRRPFVTAFTQSVSKIDPLPGAGRYDELVRFPGFSQTIRKGLHGRVEMRGDQSSLEHHMPQGTAIACNGSHPVKGSTVMRDGVSPTRAGACSPVTVPGSVISAISIVLTTGPIPGMERRTPAVSASKASRDMAAPFLSSSSLFRRSSRAVGSVSMLSKISAAPGF